MATLSTTITATASLDDKAIAFGQRIALYEQRAITVTADTTDASPAGRTNSGSRSTPADDTWKAILEYTFED